MANTLAPGSMDWRTWWSLDGEQVAVWRAELDAVVEARNKKG